MKNPNGRIARNRITVMFFLFDLELKLYKNILLTQYNQIINKRKNSSQSYNSNVFLFDLELKLYKNILLTKYNQIINK